MHIPLPSQEKEILKIADLMNNNIDFVAHGYMGSGKSECIAHASARLKIKMIKLNETLTNGELKVKLSALNIPKKDYYYHFSHDYLVKQKEVQKMIINPLRRIPIIVEIRTRYNIFKSIERWPRVDIYYPKVFEIQKWLQSHHNVSVVPAKIQKYKDLKQLLIGLKYGSESFEPKKPLMHTLEAIMKSTDLNLRLSNIKYVQNNYNIKYCLKIILFNIHKYYSSAEKFSVIRILSICDKQRNLYPLLSLPAMYHKWVGRKLMYPKELEVNG